VAGTQNLFSVEMWAVGDHKGRMMEKLGMAMIRWESGELGEEETVALFQDLVDSGLAWQLQGTYGRTAVALIGAGLIRRGES
jgi:hypothetical protein